MKSHSKKSKNPARSKVIKKIGLQTEEKYLSILKELPDIVYKIDQDGHFTFINSAIGILGYKPKDLIGKHFSKIVHPDDVKLFSRHFVLPKYKGKTTGYEKTPKLFDERRTGKRETENRQIRLMPKKRKKKSAHATELHIGEVIAFGDVSSAGQYDACVENNDKKFLSTLGIIRNVTERRQVEKKLHYQADLLQHVSDAIISTDLDFNIRTWNKAAEIMYGWEAYEVIGKPVHKVTKLKYPYDKQDDVVKQFFKKGFWQGEVIQKTKDGKILNVYASVSLFKDHHGNPIGSVAVSRDITETKKTEEALKQTGEKYRGIFETAPDGIITVNLKGIITGVNTSFCKRTGYSKEEIIGKNFSKIPTACLQDIPKYIKIFNVMLRGKIPEPFEFRWVHRNGTKYWGSVHVSIMKENGKATGFQAITRDITERKKAEELWRESDRKFQTLAENTPGIVCIYDIYPDGHRQLVYLGPGMEELLGKTIADKVGNSVDYFFKLIHPEDLVTLQKVADEIEKTGKIFDHEYRVCVNPKDYVWVRSINQMKRRENGIVRWSGQVIDINQRKIAENKIKESEKQFRIIFESANDVIIYVDKRGRILEVNERVENIFGYKVEDIKGKNVFRLGLFEKKNLLTILKLFNNAVRRSKIKTLEGQSSNRIELELRHKNGNKFLVESNTRIIKENGKLAGFLSIVRDITDRKKAEEELIRLSNAVKMSTDSIVISDLKGKIIDVNEATLKMYDTKNRKDLIGKNSLDLIAPKYQGKAVQGLKETLKKGYIKNQEYNIMLKDGSEIPVEMSSAIMKNADGKPIGFVGITRDITERKKAVEALQKSESKYRTLLENLSQKIFLKDKNSVYLSCNENYARDLEIEPEEIARKTDYDFYPKKLAEKYRADDKRLMKLGKVETIEEKYIQDGQDVIVQTVKTPVRDERDKVIGILGIFWDITEQRKAEELIRQQNKFLSNTLKSLTHPFYVIDVNDYTVIMANPSAYDGELPEGLTCYSLSHKRNEPCLGKEHPCPLKEMKKTRKPVVVEHIHFDEDGKPRNFEIHGYPIFDEQGNVVQMIEYCLDITERKQVEEEIKKSLKEKEALLKEIHHRVKNNLQIISSLLNLQAEQIIDKHYREIFKESQNRIKSMGLIHEKLYRSKNLAAINVRDYMDGLLQHLCNSYGTEQKEIAIKTDIEDITLNIDTAIPCGLIINELVSNSLKHAFVVPNRDPRAEITIKLHLGGKDETVLIVSDNGVGFPDGLDFKKTKSLGMQLICALTKQLSGDIKLTRGKRTTFTITFKKGD